MKELAASIEWASPHLRCCMWRHETVSDATASSRPFL